MTTKEILRQALQLNPVERCALVDGLIRSLDQPDETLDEIWAEEAEKRLAAYREGRMPTVPMEEIFDSPE